MSNPLIVVDKIVEYFVGKVCQSVGRHVGFVFHYKQNLKNLEDEKNNLQQQRSNLQEKVDQAEHRGEAIDNKVSDWLQEADEASQGVDTFMDVKAVKENMHCFNFSCPDYILRYRLSKQAEKKAVHVKHVTAEGGKISTVSHPRKAPPELEFPYSRDYEDFQSRHEVFTGIVEALKDHKMNIIGVYGTGGVGKTTMVTKVGELVKKDGTFDEVVIAVVSHDANVKKIQEQLANRLELSLDGELEEGRATQLWNRLDNGKKNLIILDDVWQQWEELDLNKIGIPIIDRNKKCKVVLMSRNQEVWKNMKDHKDFKIEFLSEGEAWTLFKKKVGNSVDSPDQPLHDIAWAVCKECQGLPVAINALGGALKDKEMHAWQDAFHKLKNSMLKDIVGINSKVFTSLKWSYDWLDSEDAKSCFLLCCLFPEDVNIPIDDLVRYYMTGRILYQGQKPTTLEEALYRVRTVVDTLKGCCLLLDGLSKHYVKMHDVVRDVAISIAKDEKSFLVKHGFRDWLDKTVYEHCLVISLRPNDVLEFPEELACSKLHTLRLDCIGSEFQHQVPDTFFSGTKNLVVLDLNKVPMLPLPASLAKLAKLQMLCLNQCKLGDIAVLKDLKDHLEILSLRGSNIKVLPTEIGELKRLRLLDMEDCKELGMISKGVVSKLVRLEELYMPCTFDKWEGTSTDSEISTVSLNELMSLTQLTTLRISIQDPAILPEDGFFFENLVRFRILVGDNYDYYYGDTDGALRLQNVHLANTLEILLGRNRLYPSKPFSHLCELKITNCTLKYLFSRSCARGLVRLQTLDITGCTVMEGVIGTEGEKDEDIVINFSGLKCLILANLPNLISFYPKKEETATSSESSSARAEAVLFNDKAAFPALERLEIYSVPEITEIWNKQILPTLETATESSFSQLLVMKISGCRKLMNVVGGCPKIEATEMEKQKGKVVDDYVTRFPKLTTLKLYYLPNLESFCNSSVRCEGQVPLFDHQTAFPALETLKIESVPEITEIWNKQILPTLETTTESLCCQFSEMIIRDCGKLINVIGSGPKIEAMEMEKQKGKVFDDYVTRFPKLRTLELSTLPNLESFCNSSVRCEGQVPLFDHQVAFPALESLNIHTLPNITDIWDKKIRPAHQPFRSLQVLGVTDCGKLVNVVPSNMLPQLCNLEHLALDSCAMAEVIVDLEKKEEGTQEPANNTIVPFPKLSFMLLTRLHKIKGFCAFRSEEQRLFNTQVAFPKLEKLWVDTFGEIALTDTSELSLKNVEFYKCDEVLTFVSPHLLRRLRFVDLLTVCSCRGAREVFHFDGLEVDEGQGQLTQVRKVLLEDLPQLTCLWNKDPHRLLALQSLEYLTIQNCPLLANLFTASVAKALGGLKVLYLRSCSTMEEVIAIDEGHANAIDDDDEIVFPKLEWLILKDLSNLKSFCTSNHNFNFPSLKRLVLKRCPKVQDFTSGSVLPQILLSTRGNECLMIEDLNKHLEQQHLKGDQETILDGEMKGDEDRFSYLDNY